MWKQGLNGNGEPMRSAFVEVDELIRDYTDLDCQAADDGMTMQEFADECDINVLMQRYEKTGVLNHYSRGGAPDFLDVSEMPDLHEALSRLDAAQAAFMTLPAKVRREFDNDPLKFVDFAQDEKNVERMREWGLAKPAPVEPGPIKVEITNPPPASPTKDDAF